MPRQSALSGRVLIVDDDERQRRALSAMLSARDFDTQSAADGQEALERLTAFNADVIVADLVMPRMDGFELLRHLKERGDLTPAIALTGFGSMEKALSAVHDLKAFWYLEKPVEPSAFKILLERAIRYKRSLQRTDELERDLSRHGVLGDMAGTSRAMQEIFSLIRQVAPTSAPVLIRGESGTGKELVAREIHKCSPRSNGPFVAINAAALPDTLVESELFGPMREGPLRAPWSVRPVALSRPMGALCFSMKSARCRSPRSRNFCAFSRICGCGGLAVSMRFP
jgi:DNA-binding NtrC family response regulator